MSSAFQEYGLPASAPREELDALVRVAAALCGTDGAAVHLLDGTLQHRIAAEGVGLDVTPQEESICGAALARPALRYVEDASAEPALAGLPWVDGRRAAVRLYASSPLVLGDGAQVGTLCVFSAEPGAITARRRAALDDLAAQASSVLEARNRTRLSRDAEVRASEARFRAMFELSMVGQYEATLTGDVLGVNPALTELLGRDAEDMVGRPFSEFFHADDEGALPTDLDALRTGRATTYERERLYLHADGRPVPVQVQGVLMRDADGRPDHIVGTVVDLTARRAAMAELAARADELRAARDQARAADHAKSTFLAHVSHEIRTPLNGLLGMLELLQQTDLDEVQRERAGVAQASGQLLMQLLDDVLDLSKGEAVATVLHPRPLQLRRKATQVVGTLSPVAEAKAIALHLDVADDVPVWVQGDPDRLRQLLLNLVGNAVKFTETGSVTVALSRAGDDVVLAVTDTGPGIDDAERERLFRPFEQGAAGRRHGGTGLGLALCRQLVELMGGRLDVDSALGRGSTFRAVLPLREVPAPEPAAAAPLRAPVPVEARTLRVLLVDDGPVNRMVGSALLESLGAVVETADDGWQALHAVRTTDFDVVLMDCHMPGLDGIAATRALRATLPAHLPVYALTADASGRERQACLAAGMDGFLTKPVTAATLGEVLDEVLATG
ncbi:MAG: multi-sensor hybrid histidine kinase [Frankiales bacterium]|nr:multi-sensor hybrid histidine kinase [Frankiales bacterium]